MDEWVWVPFEVEGKYDGLRIDQFLARRLTSYSRNRVQKILLTSRVMKSGRLARPSSKVRSGEKIEIAYPRKPEPLLTANDTLPILYEDDHLLVIDKPADLLSHPTDKIVRHTVLGLLRHMRPGAPNLHLLHRLDRETSGVLVLGKTPDTARAWMRAMQRRLIRKEYCALVRGTPPRRGVFDAPIGREQREIKVRQWTNVANGVAAVTEYEVVEQLGNVARVRAWPKTGRLHQIRVHFASAGFPLLGDPLYIGDGAAYMKMTKGLLTVDDRVALGFPRVALHAAAIEFEHPFLRRSLKVESPLPKDMQRYLRGQINNTLAKLDIQ